MLASSAFVAQDVRISPVFQVLPRFQQVYDAVEIVHIAPEPAYARLH
jgi:hypothetical protein